VGDREFVAGDKVTANVLTAILARSRKFDRIRIDK